MHHIVSVVRRLQRHPQESYFGSSAYVLLTTTEADSSMSFIPIQQFSSRCAYCNVMISPSSGFEQEQVAVAVSIPFRLCV